MTPAAEYGFVSATPFVGGSTEASSPHLLTVARTLAPTFALNALGYNARAFSLFAAPAIPAELANAKAVVLADLGAGTANMYRNLTGSVFYDLFEVPAPGSSSHDFCVQPGMTLTAASEHVAQGVSALVGRPVRTVAEPFHGVRQAPRAPQVRRRSRALQWLARRAALETEAWRLRLFCSGEDAEVASILAICPDLVRLGAEVPLALHGMAPQGTGLETLAQALREEDPDALQLRLEAWSPQAMAQALASCDLVLLPDAGAASRSRLIGALHAGRFGIARPSPYHGKLAAFAWVGEDLAEGIRWSAAHADEVLARLAAGQRYLDEVHTPVAVARTWMQLFLKAGR
jgi:hypothetical protein